MNFSVPSSSRSINYIKFQLASSRLQQSRFRLCMLMVPVPSVPDLAAIRKEDLEFVDRVIAWMDRQAEAKNLREGVPF